MTQTLAPSEQTRAGWIATFAAAVGLTFSPSTIAMMGMGVFIKPLEAEFGWTRTDVALAATIISYVVMLAAPLQGLLIDRYGARRVILPSIPIFAVGLASLYFLPGDLGAFYLAWAAIAAFTLGLLPVGYLRVASGWFDRRLGLAIGVANSGIGLGSILVPLVSGFLIANYGWRIAYVSLALMVLATLPVCMIFLRERLGSSRGREPATLSGLGFSAAARTRPFWVLAAAFLFLGLVNVALITQQVPLLIDAGLTPSKAALVQSAFGVFVLFGRLVTGYLLDHFYAPSLMVVFATGGALACAIYASGTDGNVVFLCAGLIGLVVGAEFDVLSYLTKRYFGMLSFGRIYGVIYSVFQLGAGIGVLGFAMSFDRTGDYGIGLMALVCALIVSALMFLLLPRYEGSRGSARESLGVVQ